MGYACNATLNYTCTQAGVGEGAFKSEAACTAGCKKPAQQYKCNPATLTCEMAKLGTPGTSSQDQCKLQCSNNSFTCDKTKGACVSAPVGSGEPHAICMAGCNTPPPPPPPPKPHPSPPPTPKPPPTPPPPPQVYACDRTAGAYSCKSTNTSTGGDQASCQAKCKKPTPEPKTPPKLIGYWRGFEIQTGYVKGETDFDFEGLSCTVYKPDKSASHAAIQSLVDPATQDTEIWLSMGAVTLKGLVHFDMNSPETAVSVFAFGPPGEDAPASVKAALAAKGASVYIVQKCINPTDGCVFKPPANGTKHLDDVHVPVHSLSAMQADPGHSMKWQPSIHSSPFRGMQEDNTEEPNATVTSLAPFTDTCNAYTTCGEQRLHFSLLRLLPTVRAGLLSISEEYVDSRFTYRIPTYFTVPYRYVHRAQGPLRLVLRPSEVQGLDAARDCAVLWLRLDRQA
jgi:hypothetical protein